MKIEESYSNESSVELAIIDVKKELSNLKAIITGEISNLKSRISSLEKESYDADDKGNLYKVCGSFKQIESHSSGSSCNPPGISFKRLTSLTALQIMWLLVCVGIVFFMGVSRFIVAQKNQKSPWKPQRKAETIDYTTGNPAWEYENPEFLLFFNFFRNDSWTSEMMNDTLTQLKEVQDWCYVWVDYLDDFTDYDIVPCSDMAFFNDGWYLDFFWAGVSLSLDDPDPTKGAYTTNLYLNLDVFAMLENVDGIANLGFGVGEDWWTVKWNVLEVDVEYGSYYVIRYEETVLNNLDGSQISSFTSTSNGIHTLGVPVGQVYLQIEPDLLVDYWEEYINYGYIDWFMAMGGLISFGITAFFLIASILSKMFNNASMGILPIFSSLYKNTKTIHELKDIVKERKLASLNFDVQRTRNLSPDNVPLKQFEKKAIDDICSGKPPAPLQGQCFHL